MSTDNNNAPKTAKELEDTVLWRLILKDYSPSVLKNEKSEEEQFYHHAFVKTYNITETIHTLHLIVELLKRHCQKNNGCQSDELRIIRYHIENFYSRITKVNDQILLLINEVFNLKLNDRSCKYDPIIKKLKGNEVIEDYLLQMKTAFENISDTRNKITHREKYVDLDLANMGAMALLNYSINLDLKKFVDEKIVFFEKLIKMSLNWAFWAGVLLVKPYNQRKKELKYNLK